MAQVLLNKLVDVRVDSGQTLTAVHDAVLGGANVVRQSFKATTATGSNMDFVIQTPGLGQFVSRRVDIVGTIPWQVTVKTNVVQTPTGAREYLVPGFDVGVEAWPMNSLITAATVQISTSSFTTQQQQIMPLMKRILRKAEKRNATSVTPTSLGDTAVLYPTGLVPYPQGPLAACVGREEDALGNTSSGSRLIIDPYTITPATSSDNVITPGTYVVKGKLLINEPLLCQPFKADDETMAFINTNLIQVRLTLSNLGAALARIIRFASRPYASYAFTSGTVTAPDLVFSDLIINPNEANTLKDFALWATFISPPGGAQVPPNTIYDTVYYNPLPTASTATIAFGATAQVESNTITLNTAPDLIAIYYVPNLPVTNDGRATFQWASNNLYPTTGAGYCREDALPDITALSVTWNNNPSLFATFDREELYRRTVSNGISVPFVTDGQLRCGTWLNLVADTTMPTTYFPWVMGDYTTTPPTVLDVAKRQVTTPYTGYPLLLALNKDIPVEANVAAGVAGVFTLKVTATVKNTLDYNGITGGTLYVVPITSQYLKLNSGAMSDILATVATEADVYRTPVEGNVQGKELVGAGRTRSSADSHAVASARHGAGRLLSGGSAKGGSAMGGGADSGNAYVGSKRAAHMLS